MRRLFSRPASAADLAPGDVVSIPFGGVLTHYGVVTARGTVISNSRKHGGVVEQALSEFENGKALRVHRRPSGLPDHEIEARARRALHRDYDLAASNCGHFTRWAHRRRPTALQVGAGVLGALGDLARRR